MSQKSKKLVLSDEITNFRFHWDESKEQSIAKKYELNYSLVNSDKLNALGNLIKIKQFLEERLVEERKTITMLQAEVNDISRRTLFYDESNHALQSKLEVFLKLILSKVDYGSYHIYGGFRSDISEFESKVFDLFYTKLGLKEHPHELDEKLLKVIHISSQAFEMKYHIEIINDLVGHCILNNYPDKINQDKYEHLEKHRTHTKHGHFEGFLKEHWEKNSHHYQKIKTKTGIAKALLNYLHQYFPGLDSYPNEATIRTWFGWKEG